MTSTDTSTKTIKQLLEDSGSRWARTDWTRPENAATEDIIERYDECPEALKDFTTSDWVNLAECYTSQLLARYDRQPEAIKAWFEDFMDSAGYGSVVEALGTQTIEDPEDFTAAYVNLAMTWAAQQLCSELFPDF